MNIYNKCMEVVEVDLVYLCNISKYFLQKKTKKKRNMTISFYRLQNVGLGHEKNLSSLCHTWAPKFHLSSTFSVHSHHSAQSMFCITLHLM